MDVPIDYFSQYNALPPHERKRILLALKYWGGWSKTSVYRKLQCPNLSPIEKVLIEGVFRRLMRSGKQLEIAFDWSEEKGFILCP